ncbi:MAG: hypothetical protein LBQ91_03350 [Oscillospiraceae bacterium]|jgi:hypothetical protein|nr:hypothetical protein [Oscillospiraceae bacterium]
MRYVIVAVSGIITTILVRLNNKAMAWLFNVTGGKPISIDSLGGVSPSLYLFVGIISVVAMLIFYFRLGYKGELSDYSDSMGYLALDILVGILTPTIGVLLITYLLRALAALFFIVIILIGVLFGAI